MKTPQEILEKFEQAAVGLDYGYATLTLSRKGQGKLLYEVTRKETFVYNEELPTSEVVHDKGGIEQP